MKCFMVQPLQHPEVMPMPMSLCENGDVDCMMGVHVWIDGVIETFHPSINKLNVMPHGETVMPHACMTCLNA